MYLASQGFTVTAIDGSASALKRASALASARGAQITFAQRDAASLGFADAFDTVVDSALYHCLDADTQRAYAASLHAACRPGAAVHVLARSEELPAVPGPPTVSEANLRTTFAEGWEITRLQRSLYTTAITQEGFNGQRLPEDLPYDEQGRFLMPVWQLTAVRR